MENQTQITELDEVVEYHPIYDAFVKAGFKKEADMFSTTNAKSEKAIAIGRYIALADGAIPAIKCHYSNDDTLKKYCEQNNVKYPFDADSTVKYIVKQDLEELGISPNSTLGKQINLRKSAEKKIKEYVLGLCSIEGDSKRLEKAKGLQNKLNELLI